MTTLRVLNVIAWGLLVLYMLPGAWSAGFGNTRRGDPMRLAIAITAFILCGFSLRWLIVPSDEVIWQTLYILSLADAFYIAYLARVYGRGPRV